MSLIRATAPPRRSQEPPARELIALGRRWAYQKSVRIDDDRALSIGYTITFQGDSADLLAEVYDELGIDYTREIGPTGATYLLRTQPQPIEEKPEPAMPDGSNRMAEVKGRRRVKLDVRMTPDERAELERAAKGKGVAASALVTNEVVTCNELAKVSFKEIAS